MRKFWQRLFFKTLFALFILILCVYYLLATHFGSTLTLRSISFFTQQAFKFSSFDGALLSDFTLHDASYSSKRFKGSAKNLSLSWQPLKLFGKHLSVEHFNAKDLTLAFVESKTPASKKDTSTKFSMPLDTILIKNSELKKVSITYPNYPTIHINTIQTSLEINDKIFADININPAYDHISSIKISATGLFENFLWTTSLAGKESNWLLSGTSDSKSTDFNTEKNILLGSTTTLTGALTFTPEFSWDIDLQTNGVDLSPVLDLIGKTSLSLSSKGNSNEFNVTAKKLSTKVFDKTLSGNFSIDTKIAPSNTIRKPNLVFPLLDRLHLNLKAQLALDKTTLKASGNISDQWDLNYQLDSQDLNQLDKSLKGRITSKGTLSGSRFRPELTANILLTAVESSAIPNTAIDSQVDITALGNVTPNQEPKLLLKTQFKNIQATHIFNTVKIDVPASGDFNLAVDQNGLASSLAFFLYKQKDNIINADLKLPNFSFLRGIKKSDPIDGKLKASLNEFKVIQLFSPSTTGFKGKLNSDLKLQGTIGKPVFSGDTSLKNLSFTMLDLSISPTLNLNLQAKNDTLNFIGDMVSGDGKLSLKGETVFADNITSKAIIQGENFLASNMLKAKLSASPDLTVSNENEKWELKGSILIPSAYFNFGDMRTMVTLPENAVIILPDGQIQKNDGEAFKLSTHVEVLLGDDVNIEVSGLTSKLQGKLLIQQDPDKNIVGNGQIVLNGAYDLMGEALTIHRGLANFNNSPIENPALNIRASKTITLSDDASQTFTLPQTLIVGAQIQGTVANPLVSFYSDPAGWSQSDILSLILLGQPANSASGADIQLLAKAAQVVAPGEGAGFNNLKHQLQQTFDLTDLRIEKGLSSANGETGETPETSTAVVLGKYLSPRLYVSYSVGIFNALNTLRVRYQLGKRWFVQTQANTEGGGVDLLYSREQGQESD
jgi:translocation and assembly module TamB